jgi:preprotein translocase subunit SecG
MIYLLTTVHVIICLFLIIVVLLQSGKAADLAGAFGGMGSQTAFGPRGAATVLSKATAIAAALFMVISIWLGVEQGYVRGGTGASGSVIESSGVAGETVPAPAGTQPLPDGASVEITPVTPAETPAETPPAAAPPAQ